MDIQKLRVKIGPHEFEAEGPSEVVQAQFEAWRELIVASTSAQGASSDLGSGGTDPDPEPDEEQPEENGGERALDPLVLQAFERDRQGRMVTLRYLPQSQRRDADAAVALLYGFQLLLNNDRVLVGTLKDALQRSGIQPGRIDKTLDVYVRRGLVLKGGRGPGGRYSLSNQGRNKAEEVIRTLT